MTRTAETAATEPRRTRRRMVWPLVGGLLMAATTVFGSAVPAGASATPATPATQESEAATAGVSRAATAADCSGTLVGHHPVRVNGTGRTLGHVDIYYRSDGWNCARLNSNNLTWGERKTMSLDLYTCRQTSDPGRSCTPVDANDSRYYDWDYGRFRYYAGPVSVFGRNRCIAWDGWMNSPTYGTAWNRNAGHCG